MVKIDKAGLVRVNGYPMGTVARDTERPRRWAGRVRVPVDTAEGSALERVPGTFASRHAAVDAMIQASLG